MHTAKLLVYLLLTFPPMKFHNIFCSECKQITHGVGNPLHHNGTTTSKQLQSNTNRWGRDLKVSFQQSSQYWSTGRQLYVGRLTRSVLRSWNILFLLCFLFFCSVLIIMLPSVHRHQPAIPSLLSHTYVWTHLFLCTAMKLVPDNIFFPSCKLFTSQRALIGFQS